MTKFAIVLLSIALVLATAPARGAGRRVALLNGDPELERALALALAAWDVETVPLDLRLNEAVDAEARAQAAELAARLQLEGVVWVGLTPQGSRLSVFDSHTGELTVRDVPELPPFASTTAAGLALSVKTVLRPSVEPVGEQASPPPPVRAPAPVLRRTEPAVPVSTPVRARASLRTMLDLAWLTDAKAELRWGVGTTLWVGPRRRWGGELRLSWGTGVDVAGAGVAARYRDLSVGVGGQWRWLEAGSVSSALSVGGSLRAAVLDGTLADGSPIAITRYNPSVDAAFRWDVRVLGAWFVGLDASACFFARYQRFLVAGQPVFAPFRLSPSAGASLGLALF